MATKGLSLSYNWIFIFLTSQDLMALNDCRKIRPSVFPKQSDTEIIPLLSEVGRLRKDPSPPKETCKNLPKEFNPFHGLLDTHVGL